MLNMFCIIVFTRGEKDRMMKRCEKNTFSRRKDEIKQKHYCFFICNFKNQAKKQNMGFSKLAKHSHFSEDRKKEEK